MTHLLDNPAAYRSATSVVSPLLPLWLRRRAAQGKEDRLRLHERVGKTRLKRPNGQLIWLHGASVGETQMIRPLITQLLNVPDRQILVTSGTVTSAQLLGHQLSERAIHQYVPLDTPKAADRFIAHWKPDLAVFVESELWPNLIWTAQMSGIPLALINARMSDRSLQGWKNKPKVAESVIGAFSTILAADDRTASGLSEFHKTSIPNVGSLKFDAAPLDFNPDEQKHLSDQIGDRPVWLAASTHTAEEGVFYALQKAVPEAYMIWLPRHPERGEAIADQLSVTPRSQGGQPGENVFVMDTLGEMGLALALADVCVLGGAFSPSLMGHNPLEAARAGVPLITGPYHASFVDLYRDLSQASAVTIADERTIEIELSRGLSGALDAQALNAQSFTLGSSGTLDRTLEALEALL